MNKNVMTFGFAAIVLAIVLIIIVPLPPFLLDTLLAFNILAAAMILLVSITIKDPLEFAAFAPALLVATLFRLSLDVSATKLILLHGNVVPASDGVGHLIPTFGSMIVGDNLIVGLVVFAILITIQFIVIAQGSQRVAEVAARFTLDAMPGKQMAIDADVHAGLLNQEGARQKRLLVQKEADFYGAMDGAGKFVKGDAIAALLIVIFNLVAGVAIGVIFHAMDAGQALDTYAILSIGNAMATTIPAFLMSISMGMMVTRVAADDSLGNDLASQILQRPDVLRAVGVLAFVLALIPGLPHWVFVVAGGGCIAASVYAGRRRVQDVADMARADAAAKRSETRRPEAALGLVGVDALSIEFGADLVAMMTPENSESLLDRISEVRRIIASETGIVIPGVRIRDEQTRDPMSYAIKVQDEIAATGRLRMAELLAVGRMQTLDGIAGDLTRDPVFNLPAKWISPDERDLAIKNGALVFDPISVIGSHLAEVARNRAYQVFGRQELATLVEHLKKTVPIVIKDVGTDLLPLSLLHKAFVTLLRERVWPRDPVATIEAMLEACATSRDPADLAEAARKVLVPPMLRRRNVSEMRVLMFDPQFEQQLAATLSGTDGVPPNAQLALYVRDRVEQYVKGMPPNRATVLCTSPFRRALSDLLTRFNVHVDVFTFNELPAEIEVKPLAIVGPPAAYAPNAVTSEPRQAIAAGA